MNNFSPTSNGVTRLFLLLWVIALVRSDTTPSSSVNDYPANTSTTALVAESTSVKDPFTSTTTVSTDSNPSATKTTKSPPPDIGSTVARKIFWYFVVGFGCLVVLIAAFVLGMYCKRRFRLDKLRHQLMPLYNYDPHETEEWETELLTENREGSQHHHNLDSKDLITPGSSKLSFRDESFDLPP